MDQQEEDEDHNAIHMMLSRGPGALCRRREPAELGRDSASACVAACFEKFVPNVQDVCRQLQQPNSQRMYLWSLYCCDFVNCGVYIGDIGQSPNVDLIINECQNIGFPSIEDPGPPSLDYCMSSTAFAVTTSLPPQTWNAVSVTAQVTITPPSDMTVYAVTPGHTASLMSGTFASSPSTLLVPASSTSASSSIASEANTSRLSGGATAAIVIFSVIAVLAITALLLFLFRRQNKGSRSSSRGLRLTPYNNRPYPGPRSASLTHLIPPPPSASSRSAQLTPPAKLSDRKYLQSGRKPDAPRSSASMTGSGQPLPTSPTRALAQSRSKSRHKRGTTTTTTSSHIITPTAAPTPPQYSQGGIHSSNTGPGTSTVPVEPNKVSSTHSCSATTVMNRPPPKHALPAIPSNHPGSSASSISPTSPRSPTFPVSPLTPGDGPISPQQGSVPATPASISVKELRDLTESYARETRESWGSWSGVGGGGPGVVSPGGRKSRGSRGSAGRKDEAKTVAASHKLDLEKLSGGY